MANSSQLVLWQGLIYGLGALGLFAIGALPLRTYMIIGKLRVGSKRAWPFLTILAVAFSAVALASQFLLQLARCLLGYHCSANAAGGWINAAFLGAIYVCFELAAFIVLWVAAHRRVAT